MATFKEILPSDIKTARSFLNQLIDVLQEDVSGSVSRRKYQVFVTGGVGPGVTSSLFQTIYDQDFTLQTANSIFDMTMGLCPIPPAGAGAVTVNGSQVSVVSTSQTGVDAAGKELFPSSSLMMREKMDVYRQFAQALLGDSTLAFTAPLNSSNLSDVIDVPLFIAFKRLFARDSIKRETFAMRFFQTASVYSPLQVPTSYTDGSGFNASGLVETFLGANYSGPSSGGDTVGVNFGNTTPNLQVTTQSGSAIYTDIGSATNKLTTYGGQVGNVVDSANTSETVGLMFYDRGILVLDLAKITSASQFVSGTIDAMAPLGDEVLGAGGTQTQFLSAFIPDFVVSASIDNIIDHIAACRLSSGSQTALTFQNVTNINSTLIFCRAQADEFNYSSNPTYLDSNNRIVVIDVGQEDTEQSFTYVSSVGMYDANDNLLAVAKLSRPVQKSSERDLTFRVRLDF